MTPTILMYSSSAERETKNADSYMNDHIRLHLRLHFHLRMLLYGSSETMFQLTNIITFDHTEDIVKIFCFYRDRNIFGTTNKQIHSES
jgi:hypothetical protein